MQAHERIYRSLMWLYPKAFRAHYRDDLAQHFVELIGREGAGQAWRRTALDLVVTVPKYRLEAVMTSTHSTATLNVIVAAMASAGVLSFVVGLYPGVLLVGFAAVIAISQRSQLARSIRVSRRGLRRRRLVTSAMLAISCVAATAVFVVDLSGDDHWPGGKLLIYNVVFFATLVGAIVQGVVGLLTPKTREHPTRPALPS